MTPISRGRAGLARIARLVSRDGILRQPLFANAGYLWGVTLVNALTGFFFWGLAARFYAPGEVGLASAVISAAALLSGIASLGMGMGLVRFLPVAPHPRRLLNTALTFNVLTALLVAIVYLLGLGIWSPSLSVLRSNGLYLAGFLAFVVAQTLGAVLQMAFVARRRAGYALARTLIANVGRLLLVVPLAALAVAGLAGSVALAMVLAVILSLALFLPRVEPGFRPRPGFHPPDLALILPYSAGNYFAQLMAQMPQRLLPLLILEFLGAAPAGYFYIAWMLGSLLSSPGAALSGSAFAEGSNAPGSLSHILSRAAVAGLALTVAGAAAVALGAPWLLALFGPGYSEQASSLLRWLAAAAPFVVLAQLYFTRLRVQKRIGRLVLFSGVTATATLGLSAALMSRHGIAATGLGWLAGNALVAAFALLDTRRSSREGPTHERKQPLMNQSQETTQIDPPSAQPPGFAGSGAVRTPAGGDGGVGTPPQKAKGVSLVVAAIPCYNEADFIADVVRRTQPHVDRVIVVDDGSTDGTAEAARAAGADVRRHETNLGPGAAARTCLQAGLELGAGVLVTLDGDGQHDPDEIPAVLFPILSGESDLVIGSRFLGGYNNVARYRKFGIDVITFLYNFGARQQITDAQSCFRAYGHRALQKLAISEDGFGFSVETLVQARRAGLRLDEVSISCVYHDQSHSMNPVLHGVGVALMVVKHRAFSALGIKRGGYPPAAQAS